MSNSGLRNDGLALKAIFSRDGKSITLLHIIVEEDTPAAKLAFWMSFWGSQSNEC